MPKFGADYTDPTRTVTEVSDGALAAFQNDGAELFTGLGLREGGFGANANRVFMLDDTGKLVPPPPYDAQKDNDMTAAARDGRLYVMDKDYRLRQVRLEGNENDGFAFAVTNALQREQMPSLSFAYRISHLKNIISDMSQDWTNMKKDMSQIWADMKRDMSQIWADMKQDMAQTWADAKEDWENIKKGEFSISKMLKRDWERMFGRRDRKAEQAEVKAEEGTLIPEEETLQTEQTVGTPKEEQIQQTQPEENKEKTVDELLKTPPTQQTTQMFEKYMEALVQRRNDNPVKAALEKEDGKPADYYEALAQELEGKIAGDILRVAPNKESDPVGREKFLHDQKPVMASISKGLRSFVETKVEPELVEDYYKAHAGKKDGLDMQKSIKQMKLESQASMVVVNGAGEYMASVQAENKANQQMMQQSQPQNNQMQQQMQAQQQMQMEQPQPQPMSMGGPR